MKKTILAVLIVAVCFSFALPVFEDVFADEKSGKVNNLLLVAVQDYVFNGPTVELKETELFRFFKIADRSDVEEVKKSLNEISNAVHSTKVSVLGEIMMTVGLAPAFFPGPPELVGSKLKLKLALLRQNVQFLHQVADRTNQVSIALEERLEILQKTVK